MKKRLISYLLTFAMVFSMMPLQVFADEPLQIVTVDKTMVKAGEQVHVQVTLPEGIETAGAFTVQLKFNKDNFTVVSRAKPPKVTFTDDWGEEDDQNLTANTAAQANTSGMLTAVSAYTLNTMQVAGLTVIDAVLQAKNTGSMDLAFEVVEVTKSEGGTKYIVAKSDLATPPVVTAYAELTGAQAVTGVDAPVKNGTPDDAVNAPANTTATLTWTPAPVAGKFAANTAYTATVNVKANTGYAFADGVTFTVDGEAWAAEKQIDGSYNLTKTFPATTGKELTGIAITTEPAKTEYLVGEAFDKTGMVVTGTYDDASTEAVAFTVTDGAALTFGQDKVTVQVGGFTATQAVTVKKDLSLVNVAAENKVYTGSAQNTVVTVEGLTEDTHYTVSGETSGTTVGQYTVTVTGMGDYKGEKTATWNITDAEIEASGYNVPMIVGGTHTLADAALNIVTKGGQTASVSYALKSGNCVTLDPATGVLTAVGEGNAVVEATITAPNHAEKKVEIAVNAVAKIVTAMTVTVDNAPLSYEWGTAEPNWADELTVAVTFNDSTSDADFTGYTVTGWNSENPGTVTLTVTAGTLSETFTVEFTKKALPAGAIVLSDSTVTYDGNAQNGTPVAAEGFAGKIGTFTVNTATNAGDHSIVADVAEGTHYFGNASYAVGTLTIEKKAGYLALDNAGGVYTYGDTLPAVVINKATSTGAVEVKYFTNEALTEGETTVPPTQAGTYWVKGFLAEDANHTAAESVVSLLVIEPKAVTVSGIEATNRGYEKGNVNVALTGGVVNGKVGSDDVTVDLSAAVGFMDNDTVGTGKAVTVSGVKLGGADAANYILSALSTGLTVDIATVDYAGDKTAEKPVLINKEAAYSVDLSGLLNGIDGARLLTVGLAENEEGLIVNTQPTINGMVVTFSVNSVATEGVTAELWVWVETTNYNIFAVELTVTTVNKTPVDVSGVTMDAASYTYGDTVGYTGTPVAKLGEEEKAVEFVYEWYKGAELVGTGADQAPKNAGSYTLVVSVDDEQYMGKQEIPFTIAKATVAIPEAVTGLVWNGSTQTGVVDGEKFSVENGTAANAGNYTATVKLDDAANYMWADNTVADKTIAWSIAILKVDAPAQKAPVTYNGKAQTYALVGNAHYGVETVTQTNADAYDVKIQLHDKVNTTWADGTTADLTHKFIINKATITIRANDQEVVVNEKTLPALTYTVSGLAQGESLAQNPTIKYASTPDLEKAGTVDIIVSDAVAPNANYNAIVYVNGTLTIIEVAGEPIYGVEIDQPENGTIKTSNRHAEAGDKVTLTVRPDRGYELVELIVTDARGREIKLTQKDDDKFTFKMPAGQVNIEAVFEKIGGEDEVENPFVDVDEDAYYFDAVLWALENGITNGMSDNEFMPGVVCNRAQVVTFLWRAAGSPEPESTEMPFIDVPAGAYYYDAVLWAVENGITNGMSATEFAPNATVTRGQTVTFLWRAENGYVAEGENYFTDVEADAYYANAVLWAVENGITNGMSATEFAPNAGCTRGQIVTFLYRTFAK